MNNKEIRHALVEAGLKQYVLAERLGMTETGLSRKLRKELSREEKSRILSAIEGMKEKC